MASKVGGKKYPWDVFVSHNRKQKDWVRRTVEQWRYLGLKVFYDEDSIGLGEDVVSGIERGLTGSRHTVLVISPESVQSKWVALETSITVYTDPNAGDRRLIPLLLEKTDIKKVKLHIQKLNWVDLRDPDPFRRLSNYHALLNSLGVTTKPMLLEPPGLQQNPADGGTESATLEMIVDRGLEVQNESDVKLLLDTVSALIKVSSDFHLVGNKGGSVRLKIELTSSAKPGVTDPVLAAPSLAK